MKYNKRITQNVVNFFNMTYVGGLICNCGIRFENVFYNIILLKWEKHKECKDQNF